MVSRPPFLRWAQALAGAKASVGPMIKRNIAIAGAGIGGLAAAALLAQRGHSVTVYDQFDAPQPVGSGLVIQPVGQATLEAVGALKDAAHYGTPIHRMLGHDVRHGRRVLDVLYARPDAPRFGLAIHRAALFKSLFDAATDAGAIITPNSQVVTIADRSLIFADGRTSRPFDLVIDSAGANSPLTPLKSRALPYGAIWATVDWPDTALPYTELRQHYRRASRMVGVLPIGRMPGQIADKAAIFWSLPAANFDQWQSDGLENWRAEATTIWPDFAPFADQIIDPAQMTLATYRHGTLRRPWSSGLVHIGDAAHKASPQLGQGANMALLDALALTLSLDLAEGDAALALYAAARRWHVRVYQMMSAAFTPQYQSDSHILPFLRDNLFFPLSQIPPVPRLLTAIVCGTMLPPVGRLNRL